MSKLKLEGELSLDGSGWEKTLRKAGQGVDNLATGSLHHLKSTLASVFALGAMEEFIRRTVEYASQIKDFAEQTGLTTDEVQRLAYAAKSVGLEFGDFQTALSKLGSARKDAAESNDALLRTFGRYGIELRDLQNPSLRNIDLLRKMSEAIKELTLNSGDRQSLRELFGKGGDKLAEVLGHLDDFKKVPIISPEDIQAIDKLDKAISRLKTSAMVGVSGTVADASKVVAGETMGERLEGASSLLMGWPFNKLSNLAFKKVKNLAQGESNPIARETGEMFGPENQTTGPDLFTDSRKIELAKMQADLNELASKNAFNLLSTDQKRASLQKEINRLLYDANELQAISPKAATMLRIEREKKIGELQGLNKGGGGGARSDSLTSVGNLLGAGTSTIPSVFQKMVDATQKSTASLDELNITMQTLGQTLKSLLGSNPFGSGGPN